MVTKLIPLQVVQSLFCCSCSFNSDSGFCFTEYCPGRSIVCPIKKLEAEDRTSLLFGEIIYLVLSFGSILIWFIWLVVPLLYAHFKGLDAPCLYGVELL